MTVHDDELSAVLRRFKGMAMFERYEITSPVSRGDDGDTPLHIAAFDNDVSSLEVMLPYVKCLDVKGGLGYTPLHYAVLHGAVDAARLLIVSGSDVSVEGDYGDTPLEMMRSREAFAALLMDLPRLTGQR